MASAIADGIETLDEAARARLRAETITQALNRRFDNLLEARQAHESRWQLLAQYASPHRQKFLARNDESPASRSKILDNTAGRAKKIARAGLQAGMASPGRPWFEFGFGLQRGPADNDASRRWLLEFRDVILSVYDRTNFYQALGMMLDDELTYANSPLVQFEDDEKHVRFQVFPIGSYVIGETEAGVLNQWGREFQMTVEQAASQFPLELLSESVKNSLAQGRFADKMVVRHGIFQKMGRNPHAFGTAGMPWEEAYWEYAGASGKHTQASLAERSGKSQGKVLRVSGYEEFPVAMARWDRVHGDVWGTDSPTNEAIGDIKELQAQRRSYSNALAKIVNPPMNADASLDSTPLSILAGAVNYGGSIQGKGAYTPVHEIKLQLGEVQVGMADLRDSIRDSYMVPLFQLISGNRQRQPETAEAIREKIQEKADVLGPVLERHSDDVFDKTIDRTAAIILRKSIPLWQTNAPGALIGPPPIELEESTIRINYVSEIAASLKLTRVTPIERHVNFMGLLASLDPSALDKANLDEAAERHADAVGAPPSLTREDDAVAELRQTRAEQQAQAIAAEQAPQVADAAKKLSETDTVRSGSALERLTRDERR